MRKEQEEAFWQTIKAFDEIGLLRHVMIIGSWAEEVCLGGFCELCIDIDLFLFRIQRYS